MTELDLTPWELAGLRFEGSPVASHPWDRPPRVRIGGDRLHWQYVVLERDDDPEVEFPVGFGLPSIAQRPAQENLRRGALLEFVNIPRRGSAAIKAFASRWGVLHLCHHNLPRTHPQQTPPLPGDEQRSGPYCETVFGMDIVGSEPLAGWIAWALRARAVLDIASAFDSDRPRIDLSAEWSLLLPVERAEAVAKDSAAGRVYLAREIEEWLRVGAVGLRVDLRRRPRLSVGGPELFGMLALQLAAAVGAAPPSFCSSCGDAYVPAKQPAPGRRNYCEQCRDEGRPLRDAQRGHRSRNGGGQRRASRHREIGAHDGAPLA